MPLPPSPPNPPTPSLQDPEDPSDFVYLHGSTVRYSNSFTFAHTTTHVVRNNPTYTRWEWGWGWGWGG